MRERKEFDPSTINGSNVYDFITEEAWIAGGVDSQVFHVGSWVLKKYNARGPHLEQILLYQEVTNLVGRYIRGRRASVGILGKITLEVEPIVKVFKSDKYGQAFSVSRYVSGNRLKDGQNMSYDRFLEMLSTEVMESIGYKGISLCAPNTKLNRVNQGIGPFSESICTVTDVSRYIEFVSKK